jgi:zinc protease
MVLVLAGFRIPEAAVAATAFPVVDTALPNGLRVIIQEDRRFPVAALQVWYRVGSRNETPGLTGISHLLEHMMFKGTPRYGPKAFSRIIAENGGRENAMTSRDFTMYFTLLAPDRLPLALELEADRMRDLLLDPEELRREREVVKEERRSHTEDDPRGTFMEEVQAVVYAAHPYRQPTVGWMTDIAAIQRPDLLDYYRTYYAPNNAVLVIVGDVSATEVLPRIQELFGSVPSGPPPPRVRAVEPAQRGERRVIVRREVQFPSLLMAFHVPNLAQPDGFALEVLRAALSDGRSARLVQEFVYRRQVALEVEADYDALSVDPGLFTVAATASPTGKIAALEADLLAELERVKAEGISTEELRRAQDRLEAQAILRQDSAFAQGMLLGQNELLGGWRLRDEYVRGIRAVRIEDIRRVASRYLIPDNRTVGLLLPVTPQEERQ